MASLHSLTSEWLGSPLPAELERATKKVKRKDVSTVSWRCMYIPGLIEHEQNPSDLMLGRLIGYRALSDETLFYGNWADLDNNFFLVKFSKQHDYDEVLSGGPWMVCGHYLVVQPWSQDFSTEETQPWKIRLPGLPYKYYAKGLIRAIAEVLGTPP
ncbi:hypothetical protein GOBAR_DD31441 [Gossypium barbadense]|nr:hypothetical protein GOBAR_DD31441 [Gossypium barbadense]